METRAAAEEEVQIDPLSQPEAREATRRNTEETAK